MEKREVDAGEPQLLDCSGDITGWSLTRIEIRTSMEGKGWPVARVELDHATRGKVSDIATAPGAFEAVFKAAGQIVGINPQLLSYNVCSTGRREDHSLTIRVETEVELEGLVYRGSATGSDLVRCSLLAWLGATTNAVVREDGKALLRARPFQVSGIDENDDLWIFASSHRGATEAIEREFRADEYSEIRLLI